MVARVANASVQFVTVPDLSANDKQSGDEAVVSSKFGAIKYSVNKSRDKCKHLNAWLSRNSHVIVKVLDGVTTAIVFRVIGHASAMAMSRAAPWTVAPFASSTGEPFHTRTPSCNTIAVATIGALHDAVCDVGGRCPVAPRNPSCAHALRAIAPTPTSPAITPSQHRACEWREGLQESSSAREKARAGRGNYCCM